VAEHSPDAAAAERSRVAVVQLRVAEAGFVLGVRPPAAVDDSRVAEAARFLVEANSRENSVVDQLAGWVRSPCQDLLGATKRADGFP
jgi:rhodanese-related sulfurtransferase